MTWWKRGRCKGCGNKLKKGEPLTVLEINTSDGVIEMEVCKACGDFWDGSQKVLKSRNPAKKQEGLEDE